MCVADLLREIAEEHAGVRIGSYPNTAECADPRQTFRVKIQLESRDVQALQAAVDAVRASIECIAK